MNPISYTLLPAIVPKISNITSSYDQVIKVTKFDDNKLAVNQIL